MRAAVSMLYSFPMSFTPSIRLADNLEIASIGVWPEAVSEGVALVCKMPETAIKALHRGAKCSFFLAVVRVESLDILCLGFRVIDEPENPFTAMLPNLVSGDAPLLEQILTAEAITLHCLNELNHPMLSATCSMDRDRALAAANSLETSHRWFLTPESSRELELDAMSRAVNCALDSFAHYVYRTADDVVGDEIRMAAELPLTVDVWPSTEIFEATPTIADGPFLIGDLDEGTKFERLVQLTIDTAYRGRSYRSPQVEDGGSTRELTDVLAFDDRSICVIQAKALSVFHVQADRPSSRRAATVTKDIDGALSQLNGAMKKIRSDARIFTEDGQKLTIPDRKKAPAHAIVVLSEMYAFVDWKEVAATAIAASESEQRKALVHVMDLQELSALTSRCPDAWTFFTRLVQRWVQVKERGTSYMRTKVLETSEASENGLGLQPGRRPPSE
jgi:hypothetical protein